MSPPRPKARAVRSAGEDLRRRVQAILDDAQAALDDRKRKPTDTIHALRVALKRWRAAAELLGDLLPPSETPAIERSRKQARNLARRLAPARDLQASLDALADLGKGEDGLPAARAKPALQRLMKLRRAAETSAAHREAGNALAVWIGGTRKTLATWPLGGLTDAGVIGAAARGYRRTRRRVPGDWSKADAEELHRLRQKVVAHFYQMELIGQAGTLTPKRMAERQRDLHRLRGHLGADHDLQVLGGLTQSRRTLAGWRAELAPAISARQTKHRTAARRLCRKLFKGGRTAFVRKLAGQRGARLRGSKHTGVRP